MLVNGQTSLTLYCYSAAVGVIETVGCSCIGELGRLCSHPSAILWKLWRKEKRFVFICDL